MSIFKKLFRDKKKKEEAVKKEEEGKKEREEKKGPSLEIGQVSKDIILGPVLSEKARKLAQVGQYVFYVKPKANKVEIKKEIEKLFSVKVKEVRTMNYPKRLRGVTRLPSMRPRFKKAIVKLESGSIPIFE
jgi:large subunit ribosomal protein L23